ncbi:MAG: IS256 family transposase [Brevinema sp.]
MQIDKNNPNYYKTLNHNFLKEILEKDIPKFLEYLATEEIHDPFSKNVTNRLINIFINSLIQVEYKMYIEKRNLNGQKTTSKGFRQRKLSTKNGLVTVQIPRSVEETYTPLCFKKNQTRTKEVTDAFLFLIQKGLTHKLVAEIILNLYGVKHSPKFVSELSVIHSEYVEEFKTKKLESYYPIIYIDATYIPVRIKTKDSSFITNHSVTIVMAINGSGFKEIVGFQIGDKETKIKWEYLFDDLKNRGLDKVDLVVSDGFIGGNSVVFTRFSGVKHQICSVHIKKNIIDNTRKNDKELVIESLKLIFMSNNIEDFTKRKNELLSNFDQSDRFYNYLDEKLSGEAITYLQFPKGMKTTIQTNNVLEGANAYLKRITKRKQVFPNIESAERVVTSAVIQYNNSVLSISRGMKEFLE